MTTDITPIVNALIALCAAVLTGFVIPWIYAKAGKERADSLMTWAKIGVQAAEQIYQKEQDAIKTGKLKKLYVQQFLESKGFHLTGSEIEQAIEAAVYSLNQSVAFWTNLENIENLGLTSGSVTEGDSADGNVDSVSE